MKIKLTTNNSNNCNCSSNNTNNNNDINIYDIENMLLRKDFGECGTSETPLYEVEDFFNA